MKFFEEQKVQDVTSRLRAGIKAKESPLLVTNDWLGIEVELEKVGADAVKAGSDDTLWIVKHDGSLRDAGYEFLFRKPLGGEEVITALKTLPKFFDKKPSTSVRTSVHIHLNIDDMTADQFRTFIATYLIFERSIFKEFGRERMNNHYCIPLYQCGGVLESLHNFFYTHSNKWGEFLHGLHSIGGRYSALNLQAITKFHTVEFRHFHGSIDYDLNLDRCNLILSLKRFALQTLTPFIEIIDEISRHGPDRFAHRVFTKNIAERLVQTKNFNDDIMRGVRLVQTLYAPSTVSLPKEIKEHISKKRKEQESLRESVVKQFDSTHDETRRFLRESYVQKEASSGQVPSQEVEALNQERREQEIADRQFAEMPVPRPRPFRVQLQEAQNQQIRDAELQAFVQAVVNNPPQ